MAFFKITKSAKTLTRSAIEYLDKDKDTLTKKQIDYNKTYSQYKRNPTEELRQKVMDLRVDIGHHKKIWNTKNHSDIRLSGYLRKEVYQKGFSKLNKKDQINLILKTWNNKLESISEKKENHVGLRRFVLAPSIKNMLNVSSINFTDYASDSLEHGKKNGLDSVVKNKEKIDEFFDDLVRDVMKGFKDRYIKKGDDIAYSFSIHHDTKVPHAHLYLLPYTKNGEYISMNASKYLRGKSEKQALKKEGQIAENKLDYLKTTSEKKLDKHLTKYNELKTSDMDLLKAEPTIALNLEKLKNENSLDMGPGFN